MNTRIIRNSPGFSQLSTFCCVAEPSLAHTHLHCAGSALATGARVRLSSAVSEWRNPQN